MAPQCANAAGSFPTILAVGQSRELIDRLQLARYFVLEADNADDALLIVRTHSRPVHLALIDENHELTTVLQRYRPKMHVLAVAHDDIHLMLNGRSATDVVLEKVHQFFRGEQQSYTQSAS
jgi:hypothetical protein